MPSSLHHVTRRPKGKTKPPSPSENHPVRGFNTTRTGTPRLPTHAPPPLAVIVACTHSKPVFPTSAAAATGASVSVLQGSERAARGKLALDTSATSAGECINESEPKCACVNRLLRCVIAPPYCHVQDVVSGRVCRWFGECSALVPGERRC